MNTKKILSKTKTAALTFLRVNKYLIVLAAGVLIVGFLGQNSVMAHLRNKGRISELKKEIAEHKALTKANLERTYQLQTDVDVMVRVAREQHFFKMADEDVFVLSDDDPQPQMLTGNETVE